jgi:hypothetical protein
MAAKNFFFFSYGSFSIRDGSEIRFGEDKWIGNATLPTTIPGIVHIMRYISETLAMVLETFHRMCHSEETSETSILECLDTWSSFSVSDEGYDIFRWNLTKNSFL